MLSTFSSSIKGQHNSYLKILHPASTRLSHLHHGFATISPQFPATQKALFIETPKGAWVVREHDVYIPEADEVLIHVEATGLNPADWKLFE